MSLAIRFDYSGKIGFGHLIRCAAIYKSLIKESSLIQISLLTNDDKQLSDYFSDYESIVKDDNKSEEEFLFDSISKKKITVLLIDKLYDYSPSFIKQIKKKCKLIMLHNLCSGAHYSDCFILPSEHHPNKLLNDNKWKHRNCTFLSGGKWIVLGAHITENQHTAIKHFSSKINIAITTGGSDPEGVMLKLLSFLKQIKDIDIKITCLIGKKFVHINELKELIKTLPQNISIENYNFNKIIDSDIVISTFGVSTYEAAFYGKPILSVAHQKTNAEGSKILSSKYSAIFDLGLYKNLEVKMLRNTIVEVIQQLSISKTFGLENKKITDGKGAERIARLITTYLNI